jgi:hypothetical protein
MNKENCEEILTALMAVFDGEEIHFSPEELNFHTANCANCRREVDEMQSTFTALQRQERRAFDADLWSAVDAGIKAEPQTSRQPFLLVGALLVAYKFLEMLPETDFGFAFKVVPLVLIVALFVFLKENPFRIDTELILEKNYEYE